MDAAAVALAQENRLPILVFQADQEGAILEALEGKRGSIIGGER